MITEKFNQGQYLPMLCSAENTTPTIEALCSMIDTLRATLDDVYKSYTFTDVGMRNKIAHALDDTHPQALLRGSEAYRKWFAGK